MNVFWPVLSQVTKARYLLLTCITQFLWKRYSGPLQTWRTFRLSESESRFVSIVNEKKSYETTFRKNNQRCRNFLSDFKKLSIILRSIFEQLCSEARLHFVSMFRQKFHWILCCSNNILTFLFAFLSWKIIVTVWTQGGGVAAVAASASASAADLATIFFDNRQIVTSADPGNLVWFEKHITTTG